MNRKKTAWLAWALCALVIAASLYSFVLAWNDPKLRTEFFTFVNGLATALFPIAYGAVGALILSRVARNRIGWLLMVIGLTIALIGALQSYSAQNTHSATETTALDLFMLWLSGWFWWLLIAPLLLLLLVFPTGRLLSPRWRWVVAILILLPSFWVVLVTAMPVWQDPTTGVKIPNPLGLALIPADLTFEAIQVPWLVALVTLIALCVLSVVVRYRRSGSVEREQLKWFLFACALLIADYIFLGFFFINVDPPTWTGLIFDAILVFLPISIGIAILRYHLFDIDIIIRRTVTYAIVVALLLVVYFGSVILLQQLFANVTGQRSEIITIVSTLVIAALFIPLRNRVQNVIDKRFNRRKYDAQQVLQKFAVTVRDETDLDKLAAELVNVVNETMEPKSVSLWLKQEKRGK